MCGHRSPSFSCAGRDSEGLVDYVVVGGHINVRGRAGTRRGTPRGNSMCGMWPQSGMTTRVGIFLETYAEGRYLRLAVGARHLGHQASRTLPSAVSMTSSRLPWIACLARLSEKPSTIPTDTCGGRLRAWG